MPAWLLLAVIAYLLMALSQAVDKALLNVIFRNSRAYACLVGALGVLVFVLFPWTAALSLPIIAWSLLAGALFVAALLPFLSSLQGDQASRIIPLVGALVPLSTWFMETAALGLSLQKGQILGVLLLVSGAVILTFSRNSQGRYAWTAVSKAVLAALLFAASFVISKYVYTQADFLTGFVWMRVGGLIVSFWLLAQEDVRAELARLWQQKRGVLLTGYLGNQLLSGLGFFLQNFAISLGTATLVTAAQGVQYAVLILLVLIASRIRPELLQETINRRAVIEKLTAIAIVASGLYLFAI